MREEVEGKGGWGILRSELGKGEGVGGEGSVRRFDGGVWRGKQKEGGWKLRTEGTGEEGEEGIRRYCRWDKSVEGIRRG